MHGAESCSCLTLKCSMSYPVFGQFSSLQFIAFNIPMHAACNNGCEIQGNMEGSSDMPILATTRWPMVMSIPAEPPASMDLTSMLLISSASVSLGTVPLPVRKASS